MHRGLDQVRIKKESYQKRLNEELAENPSGTIFEDILSSLKIAEQKAVTRINGKRNSGWHKAVREALNKELHAMRRLLLTWSATSEMVPGSGRRERKKDNGQLVP